MKKTLTIVPKEGIKRLYERMLLKVTELQTRSGTWRIGKQNGTTSSVWKHTKYAGWVKLRESMIVTRKAIGPRPSVYVTLGGGANENQVLAAFLGWMERHFAEDLESQTIEYFSAPQK